MERARTKKAQIFTGSISRPVLTAAFVYRYVQYKEPWLQKSAVIFNKLAKTAIRYGDPTKILVELRTFLFLK